VAAIERDITADGRSALRYRKRSKMLPPGEAGAFGISFWLTADCH